MSDKLSLCTVTCTGYLTQRPESTQWGIAFPMVVTLWADGGMVNETVDVTYNSKQAERLKQWLEVDKRVIVSGSLRISQKGNLAVHASQVELLGKRYVEGATQGYRGHQAQGAPQQVQGGDYGPQGMEGVNDNDVTF